MLFLPSCMNFKECIITVTWIGKWIELDENCSAGNFYTKNSNSTKTFVRNLALCLPDNPPLSQPDWKTTQFHRQAVLFTGSPATHLLGCLPDPLDFPLLDYRVLWESWIPSSDMGSADMGLLAWVSAAWLLKLPFFKTNIFLFFGNLSFWKFPFQEWINYRTGQEKESYRDTRTPNISVCRGRA